MSFQFCYLSATERRSTAAKRDDLHYKSLFLVSKINDNGTQKAVQMQRMGILLCEQNLIFWTLGVEMRVFGQKLVKFCTLTHAAQLVVRIQLYFRLQWVHRKYNTNTKR